MNNNIKQEKNDNQINSCEISQLPSYDNLEEEEPIVIIKSDAEYRRSLNIFFDSQKIDSNPF